MQYIIFKAGYLDKSDSLFFLSRRVENPVKRERRIFNSAKRLLLLLRESKKRGNYEIKEDFIPNYHQDVDAFFGKNSPTGSGYYFIELFGH